MQIHNARIAHLLAVVIRQLFFFTISIELFVNEDIHSQTLDIHWGFFTSKQCDGIHTPTKLFCLHNEC